MVALTTVSLPGASQFMPLVVWPCQCSFLTTLHIGVPQEWFWCSSFTWLLHAFSCLAANCCCLQSTITGADVSPYSLLSAPRRVVGSVPRMDLACRLRRRSWRSSRLPTSLGSHHRSLPYSATTGTQATWTALTLSGTTLYVFVRVRSPACAALAHFTHQVCCSLNVGCTSIQTPCQRVTGVLYHMNPFPTLIFAVSFDR